MHHQRPVSQRKILKLFPCQRTLPYLWAERERRDYSFLFLFWGERGDYSLIRECGSRDECRSVVIMMLKVMVIVMVSVVILGRVIIMMGMMMVLDDGNNYYINDRMITISMAMITMLMVLRITI